MDPNVKKKHPGLYDGYKGVFDDTAMNGYGVMPEMERDTLISTMEEPTTLDGSQDKTFFEDQHDRKKKQSHT